MAAAVRRVRGARVDYPGPPPGNPGATARNGRGSTDRQAVRATWLAEAATAGEWDEREGSNFPSYRDRNGRAADSHALRHTFVTELVRAGVSPKDAKELAGHSTITLTMDRYAPPMSASGTRPPRSPS